MPLPGDEDGAKLIAIGGDLLFGIMAFNNAIEDRSVYLEQLRQANRKQAPEVVETAGKKDHWKKMRQNFKISIN